MESHLITIPPGIKRQIRLDEHDCYGMSTGKCSLADWSPEKDSDIAYTPHASDINYCRGLAIEILTYEKLMKNYSSIIYNSNAKLDEIKQISRLLNNAHFSHYDINKIGVNNFVNFTLQDAKDYIARWEEGSSIKMSLFSCGHIRFGDGNHRSCVADRLGVPIKGYISQAPGLCRGCYLEQENNWYWLLKLARKLNGIKDIPL